MSQLEVERFLGRVITDAEFRAVAATSLVEAAHREGFVFTGGEMSILHRIDLSQFAGIAEAVDGSLRRSSGNCAVAAQSADHGP